MRAEDDVRDKHQRVKSDENLRAQEFRDIGGIIDVDGLNLEAELATGFQNGRKALRPAGDFRCHRTQSDGPRKNIPHEFDAFDGGFLREDGNAGYVSTGTGEAFRQSRRDGIDSGESDESESVRVAP